MWILKLLSTAAMAPSGPPVWYAVLILPIPCPGIGTHRSRGMESISAFLVVGSTRMRIIDCVFMRSCGNFASSSEPSRSTVNGSVVVGSGLGTGIGSGPLLTAAVDADGKGGRSERHGPIRAEDTNAARVLEVAAT